MGSPGNEPWDPSLSYSTKERFSLELVVAFMVTSGDQLATEEPWSQQMHGRVLAALFMVQI